MILINLNYNKTDKLHYTENTDHKENEVFQGPEKTEIPQGYVGQTTLILVLIIVLVVVVTLAVAVIVYVRRKTDHRSANVHIHEQPTTNVPRNDNLPPNNLKNHITLNNRSVIGTEV